MPPKWKDRIVPQLKLTDEQLKAGEVAPEAAALS